MNFPDRWRNNWTLFGVLIGILVLLNLVSTRTFFRLDLTKNRAYSLSKVSKTYMRDLQDPLTVKAFFTRNLPPPYNANARYLRDLLEDYRLYSRGRLQYTFLDPADDPSLAKEARSLGVYEIQLTAIERDKFEQKKGFMGLALIYRDRREVIPLIQDTSGLEYQITSAVKKLLQKEQKTVGVLQGYGAPNLYEDLENFRSAIASNYDVVPVDLSTGDIPEKVDTLVVPGPTQKLPDDTLYRIDHFLRSGKNLALLVRMVQADIRGSMQGRLVDTGLPRLLAAWGVKIRPDLVFDLQCQKIAVAQRGPGFVMQNIVPYPPFPLVSDLNRDNLMVKNIDAITLPFVSSLELDEAVLKAHQLTGQVLAKSSPESWRQKGFFVLSPQYIGMPQPNEIVTSDLIVTVSGAFPSAFAADRLPEVSPETTLPAFQEQAKEARIVVIGGSDLITNDFMDARRSGGQSTQFALNLVDWIAQDAALIEIRGKGPSAAPLARIPELQRQGVKYFNLIGLPILVALAGLLMWRRQQARRHLITAMFNKA